MKRANYSRAHRGRKIIARRDPATDARGIPSIALPDSWLDGQQTLRWLLYEQRPRIVRGYAANHQHRVRRLLRHPANMLPGRLQ